jgi:uncharacterized protein (TIGR00255 family)
MALLSMTGFGKSEIKQGETIFTVEIRSLNSKQLDMNCRLPYRYRSREMEVRAIIGEQLIRGKIDFYMQRKAGGAESTSIDTVLLKKYYNDLLPVFDDIKASPDNHIISALLRLPEVVKTSDEEPADTEWKLVTTAIEEAINNLRSFREAEGKTIESDILKNLDLIAALTDEIVPMSQERIPLIRQRLEQSLTEWSQQAESDKNRLEQELAFYIEKIDFNEEIHRLKQHCLYFKQTCSDTAAGRKLGFIAQELGREINTLGSKSYHAGIQKKVVEMKDALEKIKEQLLNVL